VVICFKFHENRSRGSGAVEGRIWPSTIGKAHGLYNSLYYRTSRDCATTKSHQNWPSYALEMQALAMTLINFEYILLHKPINVFFSDNAVVVRPMNACEAIST